MNVMINSFFLSYIFLNLCFQFFDSRKVFLLAYGNIYRIYQRICGKVRRQGEQSCKPFAFFRATLPSRKPEKIKIRFCYGRRAAHNCSRKRQKRIFKPAAIHSLDAEKPRFGRFCLAFFLSPDLGSVNIENFVGRKNPVNI